MLSEHASEAILEILREIRDGIDAAKAFGVVCDYPATVTIEGVTFSFTDGIAHLQSRK